MPYFFYVARPGLRLGEIIRPGNWGRATLDFFARSKRHIQIPATNLIWEAALETVRLIAFPMAVSRLHCVFAWIREKDARAFRDRFRPGYLIYRVEPVDPDTTVTIGDYGTITDSEARAYVTAIVRYWSANQPHLPEALIGGAVRVTAILR